MKSTKHTDVMVLRVLEQLEHPAVLPPNPALQEHVIARLSTRRAHRAPVLLPALLILLVACNLLVFLRSTREAPHSAGSRHIVLELLSHELRIGGAPAPTER